MDNTKYIVYRYDDLGNMVSDNITMSLFDNGKYGTSSACHVLVDGKDRAYLKTSKDKYVDDIDVAISQFGKLFDVNVTDVCRVVDSNDGIGILSYDIESDSTKKYISLYDIYYDYYSKYKKGEIGNLRWVKEVLSLPKNSKENPLFRVDYIKVVIDLAINMLIDRFDVHGFDIKRLRKQYLNILLFDYVTNQTDRSLNNITLEISDSSVSFAPLYDNGCVYNSDIGDNNICLLDHICDRDGFIKALFKYYYDDIKDLLNVYLESDRYMEKVKNIIKNNLSDHNYRWYFNKIKRNVERVNNLYNKQQAVNEKGVKKDTPVDLRLQYGYVKTFSLLLSTLLILLIIVVLVQIFI